MVPYEAGGSLTGVNRQFPGALVISLDFELHWGVRENTAVDGPYAPALYGVRTAIDSMLRMFTAYEIGATWATVGFLFARTAEELKALSPNERPTYANPRLDPYFEPIGRDEELDPLHFAPSVVERLASSQSQELATHTYSHYYCGEPGATPSSFRADLQSAVAIARSRGIAIRSIVFPRNQAVPHYLEGLQDVGIDVYRGNRLGRLEQASDARARRQLHRRVTRVVGSYLPSFADNTQAWSDVIKVSGLANVRASEFLRPFHPRRRRLDEVRLYKIKRDMRRAAKRGRIYHLWWHPHNFGTYLDENLNLLRRVLDEFTVLRSRHGMVSLTMAEAADMAHDFAAGGT